MKKLKKRIETILQSPEENKNIKLEKVCKILDKELDYYNWTGFYFHNADKEELILGPYIGAETEHKIIPFGKGICGQVAVSGETFVVPDVHAQDNYLACSLETKSEIVVPIYKDGKNIGQIDIDSHKTNAFSKDDEDLLQWLSEEVSKIL